MYSPNPKTPITGQIDGIFDHEGQKTLVDYKTSANASEKVWRLQMTLYLMLIKENGMEDVDKAQVLHLKKRGRFSIIDLTPSKQDFSLAKAAVKLYFHFHS